MKTVKVNIKRKFKIKILISCALRKPHRFCSANVNRCPDLFWIENTGSFFFGINFVQ